MDKDLNAEIRQLKREFLDMERTNRDEKDALVRLVHTLTASLATDPEIGVECRSVEGLVDADKPLPLDALEVEIRKLKDRVLAREQKPLPGSGLVEQVEQLKGRLLESRRITARIMLPLLEDFYPLGEEVAALASTLKVRLVEEKGDPDPTAGRYTDFIKALRAKIREDFRYVNSTFLSLLNHVKELEKSFSRDFGGDENLKRVDYFEMKVNEEVGSIVHSFNLCNTVSELKTAVISRIDNIRRILSLKKEEDTKKLLTAQESILNLKKRIGDAEKEALHLARRAQEFETQAMKDGLTGLYNRKAFDGKLQEALENLSGGERVFSVILFDVNDFKSINDTFGHVAGDKVLQKVAQSLQETFRKGDFIARYGGDEFSVIIEEMREAMGMERISSFHRNLAKRRFTSYKKGDISVKVSAGIALAVAGDTPETVLDRADKAMYAAKPNKT